MKVAERSLTQFILSCAKGKGFELTEKRQDYQKLLCRFERSDKRFSDMAVA
jgi:hypothetical protein